MIAQKTATWVMDKPTVDASPLRVVDGRKRYRHSSFTSLQQHERISSLPKVSAARRQLAAGRYDSEALLDVVLDKLIADLRS